MPTDDSTAPASKPTAAAPKAKAPKPPVRLVRAQDGFITDPIAADEASEIMAGYPGEYAVYEPPVGESPAEPEG